MLDNIKQMINEKATMLEAADLILGSTTDLDDAIILGEEAEPDGVEDPNLDDMGEEAPIPEGDSSDDSASEDPQEDSGNGIMDTPIDSDAPVAAAPATDEPAAATGDDLMNTSIDGSDLPTPVGAQTGEDIDPVDDILSMSIDMRSNTPNDTLPVPPANAGDAIASDSVYTQRIDSGFGNEDGSVAGDDGSDDLGSRLESLSSSISNLGKSVTEAISLGGDQAEGGGDVPAEGSGDAAPDTGDSAGEGENTVTAAVRDKVAETDSVDDASAGAGSDASKEELFKKLSTITKNIEDAKSALMNLSSGG